MPSFFRGDHRQLVIVDGLLPPRQDIHLVGANKARASEQATLKRQALAELGQKHIIAQQHPLVSFVYLLSPLRRLVIIDQPKTFNQLGGKIISPMINNTNKVQPPQHNSAFFYPSHRHHISGASRNEAQLARLGNPRDAGGPAPKRLTWPDHGDRNTRSRHFTQDADNWGQSPNSFWPRTRIAATSRQPQPFRQDPIANSGSPVAWNNKSRGLADRTQAQPRIPYPALSQPNYWRSSIAVLLFQGPKKGTFLLGSERLQGIEQNLKQEAKTP